jgi:hypothetical protein
MEIPYLGSPLARLLVLLPRGNQNQTGQGRITHHTHHAGEGLLMLYSWSRGATRHQKFYLNEFCAVVFSDPSDTIPELDFNMPADC